MAGSEPFDVFIGFDSREPVGSYVAAHSIARRTRIPVRIRHLKHRDLRRAGHFNRPWLVSGPSGEWTDVLDGKTFSTEFSHTRFLVPHLMGYRGWALFIDADIIFLSDIVKLSAFCDEKYAVMCVKHSYPPRKDEVKMDGRAQRFYRRKNWSSFVLWNCGHPANRAITPERVNFLPGADLHAFCWLQDHQIGELPPIYNYISGVSPKLPPESGGRPAVIHYSDGGPWFEECQGVPHAEWWVEEYEHWQRHGEGNKYSEIPTTRHEL
jgi:lipopolysaccharide biosynthesis glycosyltransferase